MHRSKSFRRPHSGRIGGFHRANRRGDGGLVILRTHILIIEEARHFRAARVWALYPTQIQLIAEVGLIALKDLWMDQRRVGRGNREGGRRRWRMRTRSACDVTGRIMKKAATPFEMAA